MGKPSLGFTPGPLHRASVGHFAQEKFLREGHNTNLAAGAAPTTEAGLPTPAGPAMTQDAGMPTPGAAPAMTTEAAPGMQTPGAMPPTWRRPARTPGAALARQALRAGVAVDPSKNPVLAARMQNQQAFAAARGNPAAMRAANKAARANLNLAQRNKHDLRQSALHTSEQVQAFRQVKQAVRASRKAR